MTAAQRLFNLSFELSGIILCVLAMLFVLSSKAEEKTRRYFILIYLGLVLLAVSNMAGILMKGRPGQGWRAALYVSNFTEFLMQALLACIVSLYLLALVDPARERRGLRLVLLALLLIHTALLIVSQFTGWYYSLDADNVYRRGPAFLLSFAAPALMLGLDMAILIKYRSRLKRNERGAFALYFVLPALAIIPQSFLYGINFTIFSAIIAGLVMYIFIVRAQNEEYYRQREENARLRMDIMLSQIQPHFLYNTLGAIQSLCRTDPAAAEQAVAQFSRYLRGNMDSLSQERTIPFARELEHAKLYLALEQLRYEDALGLRYELECTDFRIPTLTLQPLAENAVRHGVRGKASGRGTVVISSRETPQSYEVAVTDDGPGFDPEKPPSDGRQHIVLSNIRERLARLGGALRIESGPQGTRATIILPKEAQHADLCH